jgi:phosphohistidine phosphatase SixA
MKLVLFRHAEKANIGSGNPPLSEKGLGQARGLWQLVNEKKLEPPQKILSSPKLRARQTFEVLAKNLSLDIQVFDELDERQNSENSSLFIQRVRRSLENLQQMNGCIYVCSHVDWIEEALIQIPCDTDLNQAQYMAWPPGQYMEFEIQHELWHFSKKGVLQEC